MPTGPTGSWPARCRPHRHGRRARAQRRAHPVGMGARPGTSTTRSRPTSATRPSTPVVQSSAWSLQRQARLGRPDHERGASCQDSVRDTPGEGGLRSYHRPGEPGTVDLLGGRTHLEQPGKPAQPADGRQGRLWMTHQIRTRQPGLVPGRVPNPTRSTISMNRAAGTSRTTTLPPRRSSSSTPASTPTTCSSGSRTASGCISVRWGRSSAGSTSRSTRRRGDAEGAQGWCPIIVDTTTETADHRVGGPARRARPDQGQGDGWRLVRHRTGPDPKTMSSGPPLAACRGRSCDRAG